MLKKAFIVLGVIALLIAGFLGYVAMQPAKYHISRSATMNASPEEIFPHVNDLKNWDHWSPWAKIDPNATNSFSGAESGETASFHWSGNDEVGEGTMTIIESKPHELIELKLEFVRPMEDQSMVGFQFEPQGAQTKVTWDMRGENTFFGKLMCLFMDLDAMIGPMYEEGLNNLKGIVEKADEPIDPETPETKVDEPNAEVPDPEKKEASDNGLDTPE